MKNTKIVVSILVLTMIIGLQALAQTSTAPYPTYTKGEFSVTPEFLTQAGYVNVKSKTVSQSDTYFPNYYFTVDSLPGEVALEWNQSNNGDTVAIFIRRMPTDWIFNNGQMQVDNVYAKTQVRASKPGLYFSVIGPDQAKVTALLNLLENKYSSTTTPSTSATIKDCGISDSCFTDNVKTCTLAKATITNQDLTYIETVLGYDGNNCTITLVYTSSPVSSIINKQMTCKVPKSNLANYKDFLQGENMKQSCSGPLVDLMIQMGVK